MGISWSSQEVAFVRLQGSVKALRGDAAAVLWLERLGIRLQGHEDMCRWLDPAVRGISRGW